MRRRPAVSVRTILCPSYSNSVSMASRVVPAISETMTRSSPTRELTMVLLPALGRPRMATRVLSSRGMCLGLEGRRSRTASSSSAT